MAPQRRKRLTPPGAAADGMQKGTPKTWGVTTEQEFVEQRREDGHSRNTEQHV